MSTALSLRVDRTALLEQVETLLSVVPSGGDLVHQQLQLAATGKLLVLTATAPDRAKRAAVADAILVKAGTALLPARRLAECLRTAPDGEAELSVYDSTALLLVGGCRWTFNLYTGAPANLPEVAASFTTIDGPPLASALARVRYAVTKEFRPHLQQVQVSGTHVTVTDGARVARIELACPAPMSIPTGALDDVIKLLRTGEVRVGVTETHLIFHAGAVVLVIAQVGAPFPEVEAQMLAPTMRNTNTLTVSRSALAAAIRRARVNADPESALIYLTLSREEGVRVDARDKSGNSVRELVEAEWASPEQTIALQYRLLSDLLASSSDPTCTLLVGPDSATRPSPIIMTGEDGVVGLVQSSRLDWQR